MALDNVTLHFSTMLEPITSASCLSSLSIIHVVIYTTNWHEDFTVIETNFTAVGVNGFGIAGRRKVEAVETSVSILHQKKGSHERNRNYFTWQG